LQYAKSSRQWKDAAPEEGGGRYWDLGPHMVDQMLLLYEGRKVTSVYARMHFDNLPHSPTDTHSLLIIGFDGMFSLHY
jgi:predicted dehydrogenase